MEKKLAYFGFILCVVLCAFFIALPSVQAYSVTYSQNYDKYVNDTNGLIGSFDYDESLFSEITSFTLTLKFGYTYSSGESWQVCVADGTSPGTILDMDAENGKITYVQTFTFDSVTNNTAFNYILNEGDFDYYFREMSAGSDDFYLYYATLTVNGTEAPIPGAVWLLGSGLVGLVGIRRRFKKA